MNLARALDTIEYKIATESDRFNAGSTIKMDITNAWPPISELSDALQRKYPNLTLSLDQQANEVLRLLLVNTTAK